ncbi:MAG: hypothetical protein KAQ89_06010 [Planctomycetes bacterium]|nr:hypothetical protein [Planctomycetota bacterium]
MESLIFWVCIFVGAIGIVSILAIVVFGWLLFTRSLGILSKEYSHPFWEVLSHRHRSDYESRTLLRYLHESFSNFLERRNEFWTTYGQTLIAALIIITLTLLLLTKTISAEAGLPILSGISGFAIAKGVSPSKTTIESPEEKRG